MHSKGVIKLEEKKDIYMKIAEFQNLFRETQKKLPINDDALTKNYHSVEKLEDFLKNFAKQKSKEE